MDLLQSIYEIPAKVSDIYCYVTHKFHPLYMWVTQDLPPGTVERWSAIGHPVIPLIGGLAYRFKLPKLGDKLIDYTTKVVKGGIKKINNSLEKKL